MEIEKEKFNAIKELADTNMKISEAKNSLSKLKDIEVSYIEEREKKTINKIDNILKDSQDVLDKVKENYSSAHDLHNSAIVMSSSVEELTEKLIKLVDLFNENSTNWDKEVESKEKELLSIKNQLKTYKTKIDNDRLALLSKEKTIKQKERFVNDKYETLLRAIKRTR